MSRVIQHAPPPWPKRQSVPRLRSVKFKNGGEIRALPPVDFRERQAFRHDAEIMLGQMPDIAGYAIVIWSPKMTVSTTAFTGPRSPIPPLMVPEYVRTELLSDRIESRALDEVGRQLGFVAPDEDA